jgi:putative hydrolase
MASRALGVRAGRARHQAHSAATTVAATGTANHTAQAMGATLPARGRSPSAQHSPRGNEQHRSLVATTVSDMTSGGGNLPFGFGKDDGEPGGGGDMSGAMPLFAELQKLMSWSGGPVNWDLAKQLAVSSIGGAQQQVSAAEATAVSDAVRLADLWLNEVTDLPSGVTSVESWTRLEWIEKTLPVWALLCDPVASRVVAAMSSAIPAEQLAEMGAGNPLAGIMSQVGGLMFGAQVGQGLGGLAQEVVASTDVGLPLGPIGVAALVPQNVAAFGEGLERPDDEIRLYLALREAAHQRLFGHVPWLRQRLLDTVEAYSRGISVDMSAIERAMGEIDPSNPESVQNALAGGLFAPEETPEQQSALRRLETLLALVEGWVDAVVAAAAGDRMPGAEALREASRRRRATGGPAEQTFATLVGLELRPRRLREAAALWWGVTEKHGVSGRDAIWSNPDLLPSAEDLDDPLGYADTLGGHELTGFEDPPAEEQRPS